MTVLLVYSCCKLLKSTWSSHWTEESSGNSSSLWFQHFVQTDIIFLTRSSPCLEEGTTNTANSRNDLKANCSTAVRYNIIKRTQVAIEAISQGIDEALQTDNNHPNPTRKLSLPTDSLWLVISNGIQEGDWAKSRLWLPFPKLMIHCAQGDVTLALLLHSIRRMNSFPVGLLLSSMFTLTV